MMDEIMRMLQMMLGLDDEETDDLEAFLDEEKPNAIIIVPAPETEDFSASIN